MAKVCCILLILLGCLRAGAQPGYRLSGKVTDTAGAALSHATIWIINEKDTLITFSTDDGSFSMNNWKTREFRLRLTMKGYLPFDKAFVFPEDKRAFQLPPIALSEDYNELDPLVISRVRPVTISGDTVTYHTAAFPVRDGSYIEDILKRLPGVEVSMNGNVIVQGKTIGRVLVNGKEFFGGDVLLAIRNLPADVVGKLQIIDDYGDKARLTGVRSGEAAKVLNIVLKADKRNGKFGQIQGGAGNYNKYTAETFGNAFLGDRQVSVNEHISDNSLVGSDFSHNGGINYADQWTPALGCSINLNIGGSSPHSASTTVQDNFYPGEQLHQTRSNQNSAHNANSNINSSLTYKPDGNSLLHFNLSGSLQTSANFATSDFNSLQQDSGFYKTNTGTSISKNESSGQNINSDIYYEKTSLHSRGRFTVKTGFSHSGNLQTGDNESTATVITYNTPSNSVLHYQVSDKNNNWSANIVSTYFMPLGSASFLELGYTGQTANSQDKLRTQTPGFNGQPVTIDSLSQQHRFYTLTQNFHAGFIAHSKKIDFSASIDGQPGLLQGSAGEKEHITSYHYFSLIPNMQGSLAINRSQHITTEYSGSRNLPSLNQLAPYANLTNPQYPVIGNPALRPSFTHSASFHYEISSIQPTLFQGLGAGLNYSTTLQTIISSVTHPKDSSQVVQSTTYVNAGEANTINASYHINFTSLFHKRLKITTTGNFIRNQVPTETDRSLYINNNWVWTQSVHLQVIVPDLIETDLEGNYSVNHASYPGSSSVINIFHTANLSWNTRQYLFKHWIVVYELTQPYNSIGKRLQTAPASLTASLQRSFLRHNKAVLYITGYNLLNSVAGIGQTTSATGVIQTETQIIGRFFFCTFQLKLDQFKK